MCRNLFILRYHFLTPLNMIVAPRHLFAFGSPEVEAQHLSRLTPNCETGTTVLALSLNTTKKLLNVNKIAKISRWIRNIFLSCTYVAWEIYQSIPNWINVFLGAQTPKWNPIHWRKKLITSPEAKGVCMTHLYSVFNFFEEITYMVLNPIKKFLIHPSCPFNDIFLLVCQICYEMFLVYMDPKIHLIPVMKLFAFVQTHFLASFCVSYWYFKSYWYELSGLSCGAFGSVYPSYQLEITCPHLEI